MLNFLSSKIKTYIIYGLFSLLIATSASHLFCYFKKESLKSETVQLTEAVDILRDDVAKAVRAEQSCKRSIKKLIDASRKKQKVINTYKKTLEKGVQHEKIDNVNDFIDYAKRLQQ